MSDVGIIIPTYNGNDKFIPCLQSILRYPFVSFHVYVVNNGDPENMHGLQHEKLTILQQKENLGWEGGLKVGLEASKEPLVVFMNDDTLIPSSSKDWLNRLTSHFSNPVVAAVGPSSNCVMGSQQIFVNGTPDVFAVNFLVGFCMVVRRSALELVGGVDDTLPGGDDLDLSIRLRKAGYVLLCDKSVFIYHHGFSTGVRVHGDQTIQGGWNSIEMMERTNFALINKHGLRAYLMCMDQVVR